MSSKFVLTGATCTGERATLSTLGCQKQVINMSSILDFAWMKLCFKFNNNTNLTLHTVPSASPQTVSISVSHEQNNTIHLSWEPPPLDTQNGILQGYQVIHISSYDALS